MLIGAKKRPFYRVVAVDERKKRTGAYLELLGTYNPLTEPKEIILKQDKIDAWIKKGAVLSDGYLRMTKQAPQRPPRKPKKDKKSPAVNPQPASPELQRGEPSEKQSEDVVPENQPISEEKPEISEEVATSEEKAEEVKTEPFETPEAEKPVQEVEAK